MNKRHIILAIAAAVLFTNVAKQANATEVQFNVQPSYNLLLTTKNGKRYEIYEISVQLGKDFLLDVTLPAQFPTDKKTIKNNLLQAGLAYLNGAQVVADFIENLGQYCLDAVNNDEELEQLQIIYAQLQAVLNRVSGENTQENWFCSEIELHGALFKICCDGTITVVDRFSNLEIATISIRKLDNLKFKDEEYQA